VKLIAKTVARHGRMESWAASGIGDLTVQEMLDGHLITIQFIN
jgi:hypothetical protein